MSDIKEIHVNIYVILMYKINNDPETGGCIDVVNILIDLCIVCDHPSVGITRRNRDRKNEAIKYRRRY